MRRAQDVRKQLVTILDRYKMDVLSAGRDWDLVRRAIVAGYFTFVHDHLVDMAWASHEKLVWGSLITTLIWVLGTWLTPPESEKTLRHFVAKVRPGGPGWKRYGTGADSAAEEEQGWALPRGILSMLLGSAGVYAALFAVGSWLYDDRTTAGLLAAVAAVCVGAIAWINRSRA